MHVILGCDTVSGVFGVYKKLTATKANTSKLFQDQVKMFVRKRADPEDGIKAREIAIVFLYNGSLV